MPSRFLCLLLQCLQHNSRWVFNFVFVPGGITRPCERLFTVFDRTVKLLFVWSFFWEDSRNGNGFSSPFFWFFPRRRTDFLLLMRDFVYIKFIITVLLQSAAIGALQVRIPFRPISFRLNLLMFFKQRPFKWSKSQNYY